MKYNKIFIKALLLIVCVVGSNNLFGQYDYISDTTYKYFPGTEEPAADWKLPSFDDSGWTIGYNSIGWGDNDDFTQIDKVPSVYLRFEINIADTSQLKDLVLLANFDDAFVAYLNGNEFARVNLGKHDSPTTFNQLADRSHEVEHINQYSVHGYYIDSTILKNSVVNGTNIMAIEVHNDSINGSDLSFQINHNRYRDIGVLVNTNGNFALYDLETRYRRTMDLDSSNIPILVINSDEFGIPADIKQNSTKVIAHMGAIDNGEGKINKPNDAFNNYDGRIKINVRGQSSFDFPKRSYNIELQDINGNDTSVTLLGMPREADWVLQGTWADRSQIRNHIIYELGRKTGHWNPRTRLCEVIINGEFLGLYTLTEDIKRDTNRVNIANLNSDEISGNNLTGGYIIRYDKDNGAGVIQIRYPKAKDLQPEQEDYINGFFAEYNSVLRSNLCFDPLQGYKKYIDYNSLIDYTLIAELGKNCDSYLFSSYMYKDRDDKNDKLVYGPLWDFDLCFGNSIWQQGDVTSGWQFNINVLFNHTRLFQDTSLVRIFQNRWKELRNSFLSDDSLMARIDYLTTYLADPITRNYEVWPILNYKDLFWSPYLVGSYDEEITRTKNWILNRTAWIDANIDKLYYTVKVYPSDLVTPLTDNVVKQVYPNPFTDQLNVALNLQSAGDITINLISVTGQVEQIISPTYVTEGEYLFNWNAGKEYPVGFYILDIRLNNEIIDQVKVLKVE
jgi:hypothetical protein